MSSAYSYASAAHLEALVNLVINQVPAVGAVHDREHPYNDLEDIDVPVALLDARNAALLAAYKAIGRISGSLNP